MELRITGGQLKAGGAFKLVATGYLLGASAIFIPLFGLITLVLLAGGAPATFNGEVVDGGEAVMVGLMPLIMLPVILAMQAVMYGGIIVFGLWLYQKRHPIHIVEDGVASGPF